MEEIHNPTTTISDDGYESLNVLENELSIKLEAFKNSQVQIGENTTAPAESEERLDFSFTEKLTPNTKSKYNDLTPRKRKTFAWAIEVAQKIMKKPEIDESHARKRLFAEGTIGVFSRSSTLSNNKSVGTTAGTSGVCPPNSGKYKVYKWCSCKQERDNESEDMMLLCETTNKKNCPGNGYYHQECLGIQSVPKGKWLCDFCKKKKARR